MHIKVFVPYFKKRTFNNYGLSYKCVVKSLVRKADRQKRKLELINVDVTFTNTENFHYYLMKSNNNVNKIFHEKLLKKEKFITD